MASGHSFDPTILREYDIRGRESASELNETSIYHIARGFARMLRDRGIPFAFASGYGTAPEGFTAPLIEKPYRTADISAALAALLGGTQ